MLLLLIHKLAIAGGFYFLWKRAKAGMANMSSVVIQLSTGFLSDVSDRVAGFRVCLQFM